MIPHPIPVPSVQRTRLSASRPAPDQDSPYAAALASFWSVVGLPSRPATASRTAQFRHPGRLDGRSSVPVLRSIGPGVASPTAETSPRSRPASASAAVAAASMRSSPAAVPSAWPVGTEARPSARPAASTHPALMFVPPTSMPRNSGAAGIGRTGRTGNAGRTRGSVPPPARPRHGRRAGSGNRRCGWPGQESRERSGRSGCPRRAGVRSRERTTRASLVLGHPVTQDRAASLPQPPAADERKPTAGRPQPPAASLVRRTKTPTQPAQTTRPLQLTRPGKACR